MVQKLLNLIKNRLLAGLFLIIPIGVTYFVLKFLFVRIDGILGPYIIHYFGRSIPGMGIFVSLLLLYILGMMTTNVLGRRLVHYGDHFIAKLPLVRNIYLSSKQLLEAFSIEQRRSFKKVVLLEYPRKGIWSIGLVTGEHNSRDDTWFTIFVPSTPNPTSGFMIIASRREVVDTGMNIEEALKCVISGGVIISKGLNEKARVIVNPGEVKGGVGKSGKPGD
jgi:uncharacterized membrane protein